MKKSIVTMIILVSGLFVFSLMFTSCGTKKEHSTDEDHYHAEGDSTAHPDNMEMDVAMKAYACPMHPEVTGKEGDNCSKCGMKLEAVKGDSTGTHEHEH